MAKGHLTKKELKRPDNLYVLIQRFLGSFAENPKQLMVLGGVCLAVLLGIAGYSRHKTTQREKSTGLLYTAFSAYEGEWDALNPKPKLEKEKADKDSKKTPEKQPEPKPSLEFSKINVDEKLPKTLAAFSEVLKTYPKSPAAFRAALEVGHLHFRHLNPKKAIEWYKKAIENSSTGQTKAVAFSALGHAHENLSEYDQAEESYTKGLDLGAAPLKGELLMGLARVATEKKDLEKANQIYDRIEKEIPDSYYSRRASALKKANF